LDQVTTVTDPIGSPVQFVYDPNGNLLSHTDPRGNSTVYTYDAMNRVATKRDALLNVESYTHDVSSMLSQVYDRKGQVSGMAYDAMNRRVSIGFGGTVGNPTNFDSTITYTFDGGNRVLQAADTQNGNVLRSYDGLDRLIQEQTPQGIVSYTYDSGGRRLTMTVAGQSMVTYAYDNANRLLQIQQGTQNVTFAYDAANRRTQTVLPNAVAINYAYDNATELTAITYTKGATTLGDLSYTYDAAGQRVSVGGSFARTNLPPAIAPTSYNANSQLTQWGAQTLTYDLDGNLTSDGTYTYFWNSRNQAAQVRQGATIVADYHYDAFGRRMQKTINGVTTQFLFDGHNLVQELSGGGAVTANLLSGLGIDEVYTRTKSGTTASFLIDHLGTIIAETDTAGTLQTSYTYEPYGRTTQSGSPSDNSQRYTSREQDLDNLYYYRARYYATATDRFISEDPNGLGAGATFYTSYRGYDPRGMISSIGFMNSYAYASDNPEMFVDPLGLVPSKSGGDAAKSYGDQCLRLAKFQLESGKCPDDGACLFCCLHFMEAKFPHPLIIMCEELCSKGLELYKQGKKFKCAGCQ
jgi:RHS repeat-associated protein